jgi:hypothetical protein
VEQAASTVPAAIPPATPAQDVPVVPAPVAAEPAAVAPEAVVEPPAIVPVESVVQSPVEPVLPAFLQPAEGDAAAPALHSPGQGTETPPHLHFTEPQVMPFNPAAPGPMIAPGAIELSAEAAHQYHFPSAAAVPPATEPRFDIAPAEAVPASPPMAGTAPIVEGVPVAPPGQAGGPDFSFLNTAPEVRASEVVVSEPVQAHIPGLNGGVVTETLPAPTAPASDSSILVNPPEPQKSDSSLMAFPTLAPTGDAGQPQMTQPAGLPTSEPAAWGGAPLVTSPPSSTSSQHGPKPLSQKLLVSYASAVTIALAYVTYLLLTAAYATHNLESLPDLTPPREKGKKKTTLLYVPPDATLPPRHQLQLGKSERYGSLRVTPLRVTRGPLQFVHYDPKSKATHPPSSSVLKLHLRFENVSEDQEFPPLDRELVFRRKVDRRHLDRFFANNFVCKTSEKTRSGDLVYMYDLPEGSPWDLQGENLGQEVLPGDTLETYLATTPEGIDELSGQLVWRIHFRKGYNPESYNGVTTLLEVVFDSDQIEDEPAVASTAKPADDKKGT